MRGMLGVLVHYALASLVSTSDTTCASHFQDCLGLKWKVTITHLTEFSDCAYCLYQHLVDKNGWYQIEASDSCLLVRAELAVHLREHVIQ